MHDACVTGPGLANPICRLVLRYYSYLRHLRDRKSPQQWLHPVHPVAFDSVAGLFVGFCKGVAIANFLLGLFVSSKFCRGVTIANFPPGLSVSCCKGVAIANFLPGPFLGAST